MSSNSQRGTRDAHEILQNRTQSNNSSMDRVTLRMPEAQLDSVEQLVEDGVYPNRSEAIRAALTDMIEDHRGTVPALDPRPQRR